jgi:hypothetical protein
VFHSVFFSRIILRKPFLWTPEALPSRFPKALLDGGMNCAGLACVIVSVDHKHTLSEVPAASQQNKVEHCSLELIISC